VTDLVLIGDNAKVIKSATSRPVTLYKEDDNSGLKQIFEKGVQYEVPVGKELLITSMTCLSGNATSYLQCSLVDAVDVHIWWQLNQGDDPVSSIVIPINDIFTAGQQPKVNSNHNGLSMILKGVEYDV